MIYATCVFTGTIDINGVMEYIYIFSHIHYEYILVVYWCKFHADFFQSKNKISLRNLSMVLRQIGGNPSERAKLVEESVEKAKEAVQMDIQDGTSWCMHLLLLQ